MDSNVLYNLVFLLYILLLFQKEIQWYYLYNIFIYHLDINECLWDIIKLAVKEYDITKGQLHRILTQLYKFLKFYNNNYRPIYHLEKFVLYLCKELHGL